ncbi:MAG: hypothetical protein WHT47_04840 [Hydrogenothermaceae bacterium]
MKNIKILAFSLFMVLPLVSYGEDIEKILSEYEEASDLSNKTKTESLGHYTVITRKELDIMQAYTLSDVLKSLKLHTYIPNRFGVYQLISAGASVGLNTSYRLFIDDHEVSSIHTDNPFLIFDRYPLDNIDHIEIYYGAGAVRIGNEPSLIIIKLYTKEPSRENASLLRTSVSSRKYYTLSFNDARVIKGISYNLLVSRSYENFPTYRISSTDLSKDTKRNYLFFKIIYQDTSVDVSFADVKRDAFSGLAVDLTPTISRTTSQDFYINLTQRFLEDKSLKLNLSADINRRDGEFANDLVGGGVFVTSIYPYPVNPLQIPTYYYEKRNLNKYTFYISKEFKTEKNVLLIGSSYKIKENDIKFIKYKTSLGDYTPNKLSGFDKVDLFTAFVENQFNITDKNLLFLSLKVDHYHRNGGYKEITNYIARAGFVSYLNDNLYTKAFITRTYVPPSFFEIEMSKNGQDLSSEKLKGLSFETEYKKDNHKLNFFYGYIEAKDMIVFLPYSQNYNKTIKEHYFNLDYEYKFDSNNKLLFNLFKTYLE